jgi:signal peptidase I
MFTLSWYLSKTVRHAWDMKRQVKTILNEQRDLLPPEKIDRVQAAVASMDSVIRANPGKKAVTDEMAKLEKAAHENLKPYPAASIRENVKEIFVAIATIMAFTNFFLQLTKIPTGSMQPTLFGITDEDMRDRTDFKMPNFFTRVKDYWVWGVKYEEFIAPEDGVFEGAEPPKPIIKWFKQDFRFAGKSHRIWFPSDSLFGSEEHQAPRSGISPGTPFKKGEVVFRTKVIAGDHLLVDRISYNFRHPKRGEIIVFKTRGIPGLDQNQLYIKRLVGLSGESIQIGNDRHLIIDGKRLDASDRHFEQVYSFDEKTDPVLAAKSADELRQAYFQTQRNPPYRGHVNDKTARDLFHQGGLAPLFPEETATFKIREGHLMAMGDNTLNSLDSRAWGDFDRKSLIGKCWFVYWPFTDRFGWGYH